MMFAHHINCMKCRNHEKSQRGVIWSLISAAGTTNSNKKISVREALDLVYWKNLADSGVEQYPN